MLARERAASEQASEGESEFVFNEKTKRGAISGDIPDSTDEDVTRSNGG
jgi:hypothetical protein